MGIKMGTKIRRFIRRLGTREERPSRMILTVTEDTPADMLAGSMELLVQLPRDHHVQTQRVTVQRSTPMMDLLVQIATAHKLAASSYTLQAIGERGMVLPHQPNTPIGALDALQVKLLPKQGTFVPRKAKQANQPFETTFRLQVHLPRNQLYVSRVSPKMNLGEILDEVCREKNLDKNKYELRHPANLEETLDLSLTLQDYHLQEVTLYAKQGRTLGSALSTQDIMALQRQEERRRQQAKQGVFSFYKKSKESSLSTDSLGGRSASPARSDETGRSSSPLQPPARPQRKRRPAPRPPAPAQAEGTEESSGDSSKDKVVISHSRNSSDSSGYHEASVLSDNPESTGRLPETLPRRNKVPTETPRKLAQTSQSSKSLGNLATVPGTLSHGISSTSISSTGLRKKRAAPPPPVTRPLSSAISSQGLERIVDSEESLTSDMDPSKPPSDISASSKANSDIEERPKASSDIGVTTIPTKLSSTVDFTKSDCPNADAELKSSKSDIETRHRSGFVNVKLSNTMAGNPTPIEDAPVDARVSRKRVGESVPLPKPRKAAPRPVVPKRKLAPSFPPSNTLSSGSDNVERLLNAGTNPSIDASSTDTSSEVVQSSTNFEEKLETASNCSTSESEVFLTPGVDQSEATFDYNSVILKEDEGESLTAVQTDNKEEEVCSSKEKNIENPSTAKGSSNQEKKLCAVISTIPKCEVLNALNVDNTKTQNKEKEGLKDPKRTRIPRTASKSNDFETNSLERQRRHLTSQLEDITFALNLNVASNVGLLSDRSEKFQGNAQQLEEKQNNCSQSVGGGKSHPGMNASDKEFSETDVLLQKVSDTLSNSLPVSNEKASTETKSKINIPKDTDQKNKDIDSADSSNSTNAMNLTANSQQDTSDYVSAADEDLSIAEWEYQLPAPPSAFRDSSSPVFDNFDEITPSSEATKDSKIKEPEFSGTNDPKDSLKEHHPKKQESKETLKKEATHEKVFKRVESSLKKEVINELENKISSLPQTAKDVDSRRASSNSSAPKVAPVDNTLSNFTITTYTRQKNLNIFEEVEQQSRKKNSDERFVRSFATLSRNQDRDLTDFSSGTLQEKKQEPKMNRTETLQRWQTNNEKSNIQRSKSYLSVCDKAKFQGGTCEDDDKNSAELEMDAGMKKATSINSLNSTAVRSNEKFSRWRDNILKRQEEPTKESQLQSVQVLKSILPQLKSAQQAEENVSKELNNTVLQEKTRPETTTSNEHSMESNVVSTRDSQAAPSNKKPEFKKLPSETSAKRYTYSGPPAISLGSWSDRPNINVQIKKDTDYKFGASKSNRTVIDINGSKEETNGSNMEDTVKSQRSKFEIADRREPNELTKKLITHTTASGFKKPVLNKVNSESKTVSDKPVVTGVELKKSFLENKQDDSVIDTTPMNFKELSKAFDQEVYLRPKPKRINVNRRSDLQLERDSSKQNGHANSDQCSTNGFQDHSKVKRFTTIVGMQPPNQTNLAFRNAINGKCNPPMPVVKGFKISNVKIEGSQENQNNLLKEKSKELNGDSQPPKPPTMPVITGVTLKSTRPKSMPVQMDSRDMLLESIRNFGGRENLKNAAERC
ncbi:protein cordon-bleu isoform X1 [Osmia bicornis bicornis]|uniref:protein cordon-bleu isoform X1 n=2 Tax=Osmia bicornis bicornis TaxID=1437191 RepID=UPI001EAEFCAC|nr:protein cordon-bleu isoform X1 [Osmia bicornis bicornis]